MPDLIAALTGVIERLKSLAAEDPELRSQLRALAQAFLAETSEENAPATPSALPAPTTLTEVVQAPEPTPPPAPPVAMPPASTLVTQPATIPPVELELAVWKPKPEITDEELLNIENRCRLKAKGSRWAATRRRQLAEGVDYATEIEPLDREIIQEAKMLPDCFLWMCHPSGPCPSDLAWLDDLGGCFETVADTIALARGAINEWANKPEHFELLLSLLAEAQSALRAAVMKVGYKFDTDQLKLFNWLKTTAFKNQIFIKRYMRSDDIAASPSWPDIDRRLQDLDAIFQASHQIEKQNQAAIKKVRYHLKRIENGNGQKEDWQTIVNAIEQMIRNGVPPSNTDFRELLLPVVDQMPELDELPSGVALVLRELDRYLVTRPAATPAEIAAEPTEDVKKVAAMLEGKKIVLIGGDRRPAAYEALKRAFRLAELDWVETREHQSIDDFESHVARSDVVLVILAIRWSSHSYGEVKQFCDRYGKPLVRLKAGYNPNQVAAQVLAQCSGKLSNGG